ncbi:ferrochelatase [Myxococcota bacterium]|nr:ferrochelatase [Myxococcota bacterium]
MTARRDGVVLLNLGGPDSLEAVEPFLRNLFQDPEIFSVLPLARLYCRPLGAFIARRRAPKVVPRYAAMGGKSPLVDTTLAQARALEAAFAGGPLDGARVHVAMRYWHPLTEEAVERIAADGVTDLVALPLYPQYSMTSTGSSLNELRLRLAQRWPNGDGPRVREVADYHDDPAYVGALGATVRRALGGVPGGEAPHLLFSAHSIPERYVRRGDPYVAQVRACARAVVRDLGWEGPWSVSWQSKVGPVRWVGPQTLDEVARLGREGVRHLVVVPVSFVGEHIETLDELDGEVREAALRAGIAGFHRVPALGTDPAFISALARTAETAAARPPGRAEPGRPS